MEGRTSPRCIQKSCLRDARVFWGICLVVFTAIVAISLRCAFVTQYHFASQYTEVNPTSLRDKHATTGDVKTPALSSLRESIDSLVSRIEDKLLQSHPAYEPQSHGNNDVDVPRQYWKFSASADFSRSTVPTSLGDDDHPGGYQEHFSVEEHASKTKLRKQLPGSGLLILGVLYTTCVFHMIMFIIIYFTDHESTFNSKCFCEVYPV